MTLKAKQGYKFVKGLFGKYEEIPEEWKYVKLIEKCSGKPEYGAGISAIEKNLKLPRYIRITDLNNDGSLRNSEWKSISEKDSKGYILNEGDILFARTGATVGKTYLHRKNNYKYAFAGYLIRFKPDDQNLDCEFLFNLTHSKFYWSWLTSIQTWGVQPNVNAEQYSNMPILLPPLPEQQKIASILSNVDALIESTYKIIEKTERLKKGMMQKLLTKGISHTKFKKTKGLFGKEIEVPQEWNFVELQHYAELYVPMRDKPKKFDGNIPWLRIEDLEEKYANDSKSNQRVSLETIKEMKLRVYLIGTVLCSCSATIGVCAITTQKLTTNQTFIGITTNNLLHNHFFYYFLKTQKNYLNSVASGSTIPYISRKKFEKMRILLPPFSEQQKIASILSGIDASNYAQTQYKEKLERLKKSLMQKLLTGQIRIKV